MNILKIAKFVEHNGLKAVIFLGVAVTALSFYIFYAYGLGAIKAVSELQSNSATLKEGLLGEVVNDLEVRAVKTNAIENSPANVRDIF